MTLWRARWLWLVALVLMGIATGLVLWLATGCEDWKTLGLSLAIELSGAVVTYILLEVIVAELEKRDRERAQEKPRLIHEMGSNVRHVAVAATEQLRQRGSLVDGGLRGANLFRAALRGVDLREAYLREADLSEADLSEANLQGAYLREADLFMADLGNADLVGSNLYGAKLIMADLPGADLRGANLRGANLLNANLSGVTMNTETILPDNTKWTPDTDMARFTQAGHPDFWSYC